MQTALSPVPPQGVGVSHEVALARMKSYTTQAITTLLFYLLFYPVGLVMNLIYMIEGRKMQRVAGTGLPGVGLLQVMFWLNVAAWAMIFAFGLCFAASLLLSFAGAST